MENEINIKIRKPPANSTPINKPDPLAIFNISNDVFDYIAKSTGGDKLYKWIWDFSTRANLKVDSNQALIYWIKHNLKKNPEYPD